MTRKSITEKELFKKAKVVYYRVPTRVYAVHVQLQLSTHVRHQRKSHTKLVAALTHNGKDKRLCLNKLLNKYL